MQTTKPKDILTTLQLVRAGLASGLLTKDQIIDWADKTITEDEQPDIFFIDLALASTKTKNDIQTYFSEYLNFENRCVQGKTLLGLLYKRYNGGQLNLEQTVKTLLRLASETILTDSEESFAHWIDDGLDLAQNNIHGSIEDVSKAIQRFLEDYKGYSIDNFE